MFSQQEPATAQPTPSLAALRARIASTQAALNEAVAQRAGVLARIDAAQGPGERAALRNGPLWAASDHVDRFTIQLTDLQAALRLRQAMAANPSTSQAGPTAASLRAQIKAAQLSLNDALARRAGILAQIDAAQGPAERAQLRNSALPGVDGQIGNFRTQVASLQAELQAREVTAQNPQPVQPARAQPAPPPVGIAAPPAAPTVTTTVPPSTGVSLDGILIGSIATLLLLVPLGFVVAWRLGRRAALAARRPAEDETRLARMEEAITAIALDVDRVSESQRFLTSALVAEPVQTSTRDKVGGRT